MREQEGERVREREGDKAKENFFLFERDSKVENLREWECIWGGYDE